MVRALASRQFGPARYEFGPVSYMGWVCCWLSPCSEGFSLGSPVFFPNPQKPKYLNSNSNRKETPFKGRKSALLFSLCYNCSKSLIFFFDSLTDIARKSEWCICESFWLFAFHLVLSRVNQVTYWTFFGWHFNWQSFRCRSLNCSVGFGGRWVWTKNWKGGRVGGWVPWSVWNRE